MATVADAPTDITTGYLDDMHVVSSHGHLKDAMVAFFEEDNCGPRAFNYCLTVTHGNLEWSVTNNRTIINEQLHTSIKDTIPSYSQGSIQRTSSVVMFCSVSCIASKCLVNYNNNII